MPSLTKVINLITTSLSKQVRCAYNVLESASRHIWAKSDYDDQIYFRALAACCLITFFTTLASSTRKARTILAKLSRSINWTRSECNLPGFDTIPTSRTTVSSLYCLLALWDGGISTRSEGNYLLQCNNINIYTFLYTQEHTPGSAIPQSPHLGAVPRFLRWW